MPRQQRDFVGSRRDLAPSGGRRLRVEYLEPRRMLATFTVTNFNDAGAGSLREAIGLANAASGPDVIAFQTSGTVRISSQLPTITDSLSIGGPNPQPSNNLMTIHAGHGVDGKPGTGDGSRIFDIDNGAATSITVTLNFIRLTGGDLGVAGEGGGAIRNRETLNLSTLTLFENAVSGAAAGGGAVLNLGGSVNFNNSTVNNNSAALGPGGAVHSVNGNVTLTDSTIAANRAGGSSGSGGGIAMENGSLSIKTSTVRDNSTSGDNAGGGGVHVNGTDLLLEFSTVSGNFTLGENAHGGGVFVGANQPIQTTISIHNSTLSGNHASAGKGGGIYNAGDEILLRHATITENQAVAGGGVASVGIAAANTRIGHSIIAENGGDDLAIAGGTVNSFSSLGYNLIGSGSPYGPGAASAIDPFTADATNLIDVLPKLGPLLDNGGLIKTHALAFDSPAVNAGQPNITGLPFPNLDQRYKTRVFGGRIDIGAYEINLNPLVVANLNDSGPGSLRQAIIDANGNGFRVEDAIVFDENLTGTIRLNSSLPRITNPLSIVGPGAELLTIDAGGGSNPSAPDGNGYRIVEIGSSSGSPETIIISGLTFTGGDHRGNGGAILNYWDLAIVDCVIAGNAGNLGGGLFHRTSELTVLNSVIRNNSAPGGGGGIVALSHRNALIQFSTVADNSGDIGGGVFNDAGPLVIANSTISGNTATLFAGGVHNSSAATVTISASTLSGNSASSGAQLSNSGVATVLSSTLTADGSNAGSDALDNSGSRLALHNSIVKGGVFHFGTGQLAGGNNLFSAPSSNFPIVGGNNRFSIDPLLGPLSDNGGPTETHALLTGSPAIDAGDAAFHPASFGLPILNDQRGIGFARIVDGDGASGPRLDVGAFEAEESSVPLLGDFNNDGVADNVDLFLWRGSFGATTNADADDDGDSDGNDFLLWQRSLNSSRLPGDFNQDEAVDAQDLQTWRAAYGTGGNADADGNGATDGHDFLVWQRNLNVSTLATVVSFEDTTHSLKVSLRTPDFLTPLNVSTTVIRASATANAEREAAESNAQHVAFSSLAQPRIAPPVFSNASESLARAAISTLSNPVNEETSAGLEALFDAAFQQIGSGSPGS